MTKDTYSPPNFIAQAGQDKSEIVLDNIEFYPRIYLLDFQQKTQIDETFTPERQIKALETAIREINNDLKKWLNTQHKLIPKPQKLEETEGEVYGTGSNAQHEKVSDYQVAVYAKAKAKLLEKYRDYDTTKKGRERDREVLPNADEYHQESREAVRRIMGESRMTAVLI